MLLPKAVWDGITDGTVTCAFRRWKRPTVRTGGTLQSPVGLLSIDAVEVVDPADITDAQARRAGAEDGAAVRAALRDGPDRVTYRIDFHLLGEDPRAALRASEDLSGSDVEELTAALARLDAAAADGAWTGRFLDLIGAHEGRRAPDLAEMVDEAEVPRFKRRVRRLKALGLTESLRIGYRISPRGQAYLDAVSGSSPSRSRARPSSPPDGPARR